MQKIQLLGQDVSLDFLAVEGFSDTLSIEKVSGGYKILRKIKNVSGKPQKLAELKAVLSGLDFKKDLILGILAGLTITLKQTTGIFICMVLLGNKLLFVK